MWQVRKVFFTFGLIVKYSCLVYLVKMISLVFDDLWQSLCNGIMSNDVRSVSVNTSPTEWVDWWMGGWVDMGGLVDGWMGGYGWMGWMGE